MSNLGLVAIGAGLSQAALLVLLLLHGQKANLSRSLFGLLIFAVICYLLTPLTADWPEGWIFGAMSTLVPGAFWLFSASLFDDHFELRWWQPALVILSVVMPAVWSLSGAPEGAAQMVLVEAPQLMEYVFLLLALHAIFRNWKDDLLLARRNLRIWFCGTAGIFILLLILAREVFFTGATWLQDTQYLATAVVLVGMNFILLRFVPGLLDPIQRTVSLGQPLPKPAPEPQIDPQLAAVVSLVEEKQIHHEYGLTIGKLATAAEIPEYRLRQMINASMGFRNFNDFLNGFRIREASQRLVDPAEFKIPVLTIALDVGFRSISSFNKAFKDVHGMTPTAYRKQNAPAEFR
jgi:AraC-like DNA-binding protein